MKLFIGLGNPGKKYQNTRHNVGHQLIDILKSLDLPQVKLATNDSHMNESGLSVQKVIHFYKLPLNNVYIIHDDLDLPVGEYRLQFDRGPAGHHGVESVIAHLGTQAFNRIRIGIGHPSIEAVEDYVLRPFIAEEKIIIQKTFEKIITDIKSII